MTTSVRRFDAWLRMVAGTALLCALSGALGAQGPAFPAGRVTVEEIVLHNCLPGIDIDRLSACDEGID